MATVIRNTEPMAAAMCAAHNDLKAQIGAGASYHLDASEFTITAADATDLASLIALVNQCYDHSVFHRADTLAHKVADAATITAPKAKDLATAEALINELKADFNVHAVSTTYHYNADTVIATADATDLASAETLANAYKAKLNTHCASAPAAHSLRLVNA